MTDLETMKDMLRRAGIAFSTVGPENEDTDQETVVHVEEGYVGFFTEIVFKPGGALVSMKAFE